MDFQQIATELAIASPSLAVYAVGGLVAMLRWRQHPAASLWALLGLGVLFLSYVGGIAARAAILAAARDGAFEQVSGMFTLVGVANGIAHALGIGLLLAAVFVGRGAPE